jgi:hypothetical protein
VVVDFVDDRVAVGLTVEAFVVVVFFTGTFFVAACFSAKITSSSKFCIERSQILISIFEESSQCDEDPGWLVDSTNRSLRSFAGMASFREVIDWRLEGLELTSS